MATLASPAPHAADAPARARATALAAHPGIGLALVRLALGVVFIAHGGQKVFVHGLDGVTSGFAGMGIPLAAVSAPLVAFVELLGGLAVLLGVGSRIAALLLAGTMLGAIGLVHLGGGFFAPNGIEFQLVLLLAALAVAIGGPGALALRGTRTR